MDGDDWRLMEMNIYIDGGMEGGRDGWMDMNGGEWWRLMETKYDGYLKPVKANG